MPNRNMTIYGKLVSFNETDAKLKTDENVLVTVPRDAVFPNVNSVKMGAGKVSAKISFEELRKFNPKIDKLYTKFVVSKKEKEKK